MTPNTNANQNLLADAIRTSINPDDIKVIIKTIVGKAKLGCLPSAKFVFDELLTHEPVSDGATYSAFKMHLEEIEKNLRDLKCHEREISLKPVMKASSGDVLAFESRMAGVISEAEEALPDELKTSTLTAAGGEVDELGFEVKSNSVPAKGLGKGLGSEKHFIDVVNLVFPKTSSILPESPPVTAGHNSVEYPVSQNCTESGCEKMAKTKHAKKAVTEAETPSPSGQTSDIERIVLWLKIVGDGKAPDIAKGAGLSLAETLAVIDHNPKWFECKNNRYSLKTRV